MDEKGAETLYVMRVNNAVANAGVAVIGAGQGALIHPWLLGSPDENDVQGYPGTPVNVNSLTFGYRADVGRGRAALPAARPLLRRARLRLRRVHRTVVRRQLRPPRPGRTTSVRRRIRLLTTRVAAGRSLIAARVTDAGAGVDPISLVIAYRQALVGAAAYDPVSGLALFPIPAAAPPFRAGRTPADPARRRLPGVEERRPGGRERPPEHPLPADPRRRRAAGPR